jgi:hypothetical protein
MSNTDNNELSPNDIQLDFEKDENSNINEVKKLCEILPHTELLNEHKGISGGINHCFIHAAMQMILHNKRFCYKIMQFKDSIETNRDFLNRLSELIVKYYNDKTTIVIDKTDYDFLNEACKFVSGNEQEDVDEFLRSTFLSEKFEINGTNIFKSIYGFEETTKYIEPFSSYETSDSSVNQDIVLNLKLGGGKTLDELYNENITKIISGTKQAAQENLDLLNANVELTNDDIKKMLTRMEQTKISYIKKDLLIMLNRNTFINNVPGKSNEAIDMPYKWHNFQLKGFISHIGKSGKSGHYIYYGFYKNKWFKYDDSTITEISDEKEIDEQKNLGYYYYYEKDESLYAVRIEEIPFPEKEHPFNLEGNFALYKDKIVFIDKKDSNGIFIFSKKGDKKMVDESKLSMPTLEDLQKHLTPKIISEKIIKRFEKNEKNKNKEDLETKLFFQKPITMKSKKGGHKSTNKHNKDKHKNQTINKRIIKNKSIKKHLKNK